MLLNNIELKLQFFFPLFDVERLAAHRDRNLLVLRHHLRLQRLHIREAHVLQRGVKIRTAHLLPHVAEVRVHPPLRRRPTLRRLLRDRHGS